MGNLDSLYNNLEKQYETYQKLLVLQNNVLVALSSNNIPELDKFLKEEQENNPNGIWETNLFGKSLQSLIYDGVNNKIVAMPNDAQKKMRKTLTRIVNEGKGGII